MFFQEIWRNCNHEKKYFEDITNLIKGVYCKTGESILLLHKIQIVARTAFLFGFSIHNLRDKHQRNTHILVMDNGCKISHSDNKSMK